MRHMILIANEKFELEPKLSTLKCPKNDATRLAEILRDRDFGEFNREHVLLDNDHTSIEQTIYRVFKNATRDDFVLMYYSGHGKTNDVGDLFLCTKDTTLDEIDVSSLSTKRIKECVENTQCRKIAIILDCCFSGRAGSILSRSDADHSLAELVSDIEKRERGGKGLILMTSSTSAQRSYEEDTGGHGIFTQNIIRGIREGEADADRDGLVTFPELFEYVSLKVEESKGNAQTPAKWEVNVQGNMYIAKNVTVYRQLESTRIDAKLQELKKLELVSEQIYFDLMESLARFRKGEQIDEEVVAFLQSVAQGNLPVSGIELGWSKIGRGERAASSEELRRKVAPDFSGIGRAEAQRGSPGIAPEDFGAYSQLAVKEYLGKYICIRPSFTEENTLTTFSMELVWSDKYDYLYFKEIDAKGGVRDRGYVFVPLSSQYLSLVSIAHGSVRHMIMSKPDHEGHMFGVISTLFKPSSRQYFPVVSPFVMVKQGRLDVEEFFGKLARRDPLFPAYLRLLQEAENGFAKIISSTLMH